MSSRTVAAMNVKTKSWIAACAVALVVGITPALAEDPTAPATPAASPAASVGAGKPLVLIPYEEPGSTDPHASAITAKLAADLPAAGVAVTSIAPVDHLDAVAGAAKICADNAASGILIPEGRYEQTKKVFPTLWVTIERYPTHAEFRLDELGCDGVIRWTMTTTGDEARTGVFSVGNLGSAVDGAFRTAIEAAVKARAAATVPQGMAIAPAAAPAPAVAPAAPPSTFLLVPFEQPTVGDPHAPDVTHSLLLNLQQHKLDVKVGTPIDHLSAIAGATQLCTASGVQAIIVPNMRVESSSATGRSHASLRLTLLSCGGSVLGHGLAEADMGKVLMYNFGSAVTAVSERAMGPAIEQLFPNAPKAPPPASS